MSFLKCWVLNGFIILNLLNSGVVFASNAPVLKKSTLEKKKALQKEALQGPDAMVLFKRLEEVTSALKGYSIVHTQQELFGEKLGPIMQMHLKYLEGRVYVKMLEGPRKDAEILYVPGQNEGRAKVHPGSFPDLTLNLQLISSRLLEDQHHTIDHAGFPWIVRTLAKNVNLGKKLGAGKLTYVGESKIEGQPSYLLEMKSPVQSDDQKRHELVKADEDLWTFAKRVEADPYVILHNNGLSSPGDVEEGQKLYVPLFYASRTLIAVHQKTGYLTMMQTFDEKDRLYESYRWHQMDTTSPLGESDFDPENKAYRF